MPKGIAVKLQDRINEAKNGDTQNVKQLRSVLKELFPKKIFNSINQRDTATWRPHLLAACAFLWMACNEKNLTDSFAFVHKIVLAIFTTVKYLGTSYQGFTNQLGRYNARMMSVILPHLRDLTKSKLKDFWLVAGFLLVGVDGSRVQLAWTKSLKAAFAPKKKKNDTKKKHKNRTQRYKNKQSEKDRQKKAESPQLWLTLLWHVGTGLPYNWRLGPSDSSEREHAMQMFVELPDGALVVADAGFIGYDFWSSLVESKKRFLIRVGGNVMLLRKLGWSVKERHDTVYLWPKGKRDREPLCLRLIRIHDGKHPLCLVTNLEEEELSCEAALEIYRRRWGIELFFRTLKQTFGRRKLRSTGATNAPLELEWSLVTLWGMCLFGEESVRKSGGEVSRTSAAKVLKAFGASIRDCRVDVGSEESLTSMLTEAVFDDYERNGSKTNREYPRKSQRVQIHEPVIEIASKTTRNQAKTLKSRSSIA